MAKLILAALLAACVAGCGGGSDPLPAQPPASAPACVAKVVTVALLGDSTMYGYDSSTQAQAIHNPGVELQSRMDAMFGAGAVVVTNYGVPGTVVSEANRISADVIVANYGINQQNAGVSAAQFADQVKALNPTLVETQNPIAMTSYEPDQASYVSSAISLGIPVADTYSYVLSLPDWQKHEADSIHPDDALYMLIVDSVLAPAVAKQVAPLRCDKS